MTFDLTRIDIESIKQELPLKKKELDSKFNVHDFVVVPQHRHRHQTYQKNERIIRTKVRRAMNKTKLCASIVTTTGHTDLNTE
jgi:hypothetical protein